MHTQLQFSNELEKINTALSNMGSLVQEQLTMASLALQDGNLTLAQEVKSKEETINSLQLEIQDQVAVFICTQSPVASDLRTLLTVYKLTDNLERAGDHAVHLAKAILKLGGRIPKKIYPLLAKMAEIECQMLKNTIISYLESNTSLARQTASLDDEVDTQHKLLVKKILCLMRKKPKLAKKAAILMTTSNYMERLGDHITNMCEAIVFMVEGKHMELNN